MKPKKIKKLIKDNGYNQTYVAQRIGVDKGHLNKVLRGVHPLTKEMISKLEVFFISRGITI